MKEEIKLPDTPGATTSVTVIDGVITNITITNHARHWSGTEWSSYHPDDKIEVVKP